MSITVLGTVTVAREGEDKLNKGEDKQNTGEDKHKEDKQKQKEDKQNLLPLLRRLARCLIETK